MISLLEKVIYLEVNMMYTTEADMMHTNDSMIHNTIPFRSKEQAV